MEFKFSVNEVFRHPIVKIGSNLLPPGFTGDRRAFWDVLGKVSEVVNAMGEASAAAQGLTKPITTSDRLRNSEQTVYLLVDQNAANGRGAVTGMLKIGKKGLYVFDRNGQHYQVSPPCVLDFYVHESRQRTGLGKRLFEHMLQEESVEPVKMAIDRPSEKFLGFLNKHYSLNNPVKQMNNYVVFDGFFPNTPEKNGAVELSHSGSTPGKKQSANGLQTTNYASPLGRYGAPRPPCSMGQIIHNQTSTMSKNTEPTGICSVAGVRSAPETSYQSASKNSPGNPNVTQSAPHIHYQPQKQQIKLDGLDQMPPYETDVQQNAGQTPLQNEAVGSNPKVTPHYDPNIASINQIQEQSNTLTQLASAQTPNSNMMQYHTMPQVQTVALNSDVMYNTIQPQGYMPQYVQRPNMPMQHMQAYTGQYPPQRIQPTASSTMYQPDATQNMQQQPVQMQIGGQYSGQIMQSYPAESNIHVQPIGQPHTAGPYGDHRMHQVEAHNSQIPGGEIQNITIPSEQMVNGNTTRQYPIQDTQYPMQPTVQELQPAIQQSSVTQSIQQQSMQVQQHANGQQTASFMQHYPMESNTQLQPSSQPQITGSYGDQKIEQQILKPGTSHVPIDQLQNTAVPSQQMISVETTNVTPSSQMIPASNNQLVHTPTAQSSSYIPQQTAPATNFGHQQQNLPRMSTSNTYVMPENKISSINQQNPPQNMISYSNMMQVPQNPMGSSIPATTQYQGVQYPNSNWQPAKVQYDQPLQTQITNTMINQMSQPNVAVTSQSLPQVNSNLTPKISHTNVTDNTNVLVPHQLSNSPINPALTSENYQNAQITTAQNGLAPTDAQYQATSLNLQSQQLTPVQHDNGNLQSSVHNEGNQVNQSQVYNQQPDDVVSFKYGYPAQVADQLQQTIRSGMITVSGH